MSHDHSPASEGNLKIAFFLNFGFTIIEIIGGLWTNSIAILTDALHDAGDTASLGLAWYFDKLSNKERNAEHTYGYKRFRLLGGLITGVLIFHNPRRGFLRLGKMNSANPLRLQNRRANLNRLIPDWK